jgi:hypothetical protein
MESTTTTIKALLSRLLSSLGLYRSSVLNADELATLQLFQTAIPAYRMEFVAFLKRQGQKDLAAILETLSTDT